MAYAEQVPATIEDAINKIATFAVAAGWVQHRNTLAGSNRTVTLRKGGAYIHLWNVDQTFLRLRGSIGYDGGQAPTTQPNQSTNIAISNLGAGPFTRMFLFSDELPSPHVHVVIEVSGGVFRHISFGEITKIGTWTGGTYFDASRWGDTASNAANGWNSWNHALFDTGTNSSVSSRGDMWVDVPDDGKSNAWATQLDSASHFYITGLWGGIGNNGEGLGRMTTQFANRNVAPFSGQVTLGTIRADVRRTGGFYSPVGVFPNARYLNIERFAPAQEITVGSDTWKVFPLVRKGTSPNNSESYSGNHGFAFKKVS